MMDLWSEDDPLIQASDLDSEPALVLAFHVRSDDRSDEAAGDFIAGVSPAPTAVADYLDATGV